MFGKISALCVSFLFPLVCAMAAGGTADDAGPSTLADFNKILQTRPHKPVALKGRALIFMEAGQYKKAVADLDEFFNCCPNSWTASSWRTVARAFAGDNLGSLRDVTRYLYIKRNVTFHIRFSAVRADLEDKAHPGPIAPPELAIEAKECERIRQTANHKLGSDSAANHRASAVLAFFEHDYRKALSELGRVKASGPELATLLAWRSICHRATGDYQQSIEEARRAISLMPGEQVFYDTLDGAYFAASKREEGLKELVRYAQASPDNPAVVLTLADVNSQLGEREKARVMLTRLLTSNPSMVEALTMRAETYKADLMNEKALADFNKARQLDLRNGKAIEGAGFCCYELNRIDQAIDAFQKAMDLGYDLKRVYVAKALCLDRKGKSAAATRLRAESSLLML